MVSYQYTSLDKSELRLIHLLPGSFNDDLTVRIVHMPFSPAKIPNYEALSYTWGSENDPGSISVRLARQKTGFISRFRRTENRTNPTAADTKVGTLSVTSNLEMALRHLRRVETFRVLWVDAICINQQDLQERTTEVNRMGDIYRSASQVIVWVGPKSVDSGLAMDTLSQLSQHLKSFDTEGNLFYTVTNPNNPYLFRGDSEEILIARRAALSAFFRRQWFARLWIWQELVLATKIVVVCGSCMISYPDFKRATLMALGQLPGGEPMHECLDERVGQAIFRLVSLGRISPALTTLIDYTKFALCKDPRDRIFALRSLLPTDIQLETKVDYTRTPEEVYKHACLSSIKLCQSLEILTFCEMPYPSTWQSSWVPNLSTPKLSSPISYGHASGMSTPEVHSMKDHKLLVEAVNVTSIRSRSSEIPLEADLKEILEKVRGWASDYLSGLSDEEKHESVRNFVCAILCRQVVVEDIDDRSFLTFEDQLQSFSTFISNGTGNISPEELLQLSFVKTTLSTLPGRAMFKTREGSIGLGPGALKTGDHVYVFLGCNVPMIIRPIPQILNHGRIVGACYVAGLMDKEALLGLLPSSIRRWCSVFQARPMMMYSNHDDNRASMEDPRLGPFPFGWQLYEQSVYPHGFDDISSLRNLVRVPKDFHGDPRLTSQALKARGVNIKTLTLV